MGLRTVVPVRVVASLVAVRVPLLRTPCYATGIVTLARSRAASRRGTDAQIFRTDLPGSMYVSNHRYEPDGTRHLGAVER